MTSIAEAIGDLLHAEKEQSNSSLSLIRACAFSTDMEAEIRAVFRTNGGGKDGPIRKELRHRSWCRYT